MTNNIEKLFWVYYQIFEGKMIFNLSDLKKNNLKAILPDLQLIKGKDEYLVFI